MHGNDTKGTEPLCYASPACEWASDLDRAYFAAHPNENQRLRPLIPGEFPAGVVEPQCNGVLVTNLAPRVRARQPVRLVLLPEDASVN